jgi:hypothetical protein
MWQLRHPQSGRHEHGDAIGYLFAAFKAQAQQHEALIKRIAELEARIANLEK